MKIAKKVFDNRNSKDLSVNKESKLDHGGYTNIFLALSVLGKPHTTKRKSLRKKIHLLTAKN